MIRIITLPLQSIFDAIHRRRNAKKMMHFCLGIKANHLSAGSGGQGAAHHGK